MLKFTMGLKKLEDTLRGLVSEKKLEHIEELFTHGTSDERLKLLLEIYYNRLAYEGSEQIRSSIDATLKEEEYDNLDELYTDLEEVENTLASLNPEAVNFKKEQRDEKAKQKRLLDIHKACVQSYNVKEFFSRRSEQLSLPQAAAAMTSEQIQEDLASIDVIMDPPAGYILDIVTDAKNGKAEYVELLEPLPLAPVAIRAGRELYDIELNEIYDRFNCILGLPECAEKSLSILAAHFSVQQKQQEFRAKGLNIEDLTILSPSQVLLVFDKFTKQILVEGLNDTYIKNEIIKLKQLIIDNNQAQIESVLEQLGACIIKLLKYLQPVDLGLMLRLIEKTQIAAEQIRNKDIILLLGVTGAGKSTTIHFLAGSKMEKILVKGLKHIQPVSYSDDRLRSFVTSPYTRSETRSINAITINLQGLSEQQDREVTLCDSPGFGDTDGIEVDISNGICLVRALQGCHSVKPVILFSNKSLGDRMEGLIVVANTLSALIPSIRDQLPAFSYIFTKVPPDEKGQINPLIEDKRDSLTPSERANTAMVALLSDMIKKTAEEKDIIVVDPIKDNPREVLDRLCAGTVVTAPHEQFADFANPASLTKLKEQLLKDEQSFKRAFLHGHVVFANYKLNQFKILYEVLKFAEVDRIYHGAVEFLGQRFNEIQESIKNIFGRIVMVGNVAIEADLQLSISCIQHLCMMEELRLKHTPNYSNLVQLTQLFVIKLLKDLEKTDSTDGIKLNKIKQIVDQFSIVFSTDTSYVQKIQEVYRDSLKGIEDSLSQFHDQAITAIEQGQFDEVTFSAEQLTELQNNHQLHLAVHFNELPERLHQHIVNWLREQSTQILKGIDIIVEKTRALKEAEANNSETISPDDIARLTAENSNYMDSLSKKITLVHKAANNPGFSKFYGHEELTAITNKIDNYILEYFDGIEKNVFPSIWLSNKTGCFTYFYIQLMYLNGFRQNYQIHSKTSDIYARILRLLVAYIEEINSKVLIQINLMQSVYPFGKAQINFEELRDYILGLQNASIFLGHPENIYQNKLEFLKERVTEITESVKSQLKGHLSLECLDDLSMQLIMVEGLIKLLPIEQLLHNEMAIIPETVNDFKLRIKEILATINYILKNNKLTADVQTFFMVLKFFQIYKLDFFREMSVESAQLSENVIMHIRQWYKEVNGKLNITFDKFSGKEIKSSEGSAKSPIKSILPAKALSFFKKKSASQGIVSSKDAKAIDIIEVKEFCSILLFLHEIFEKQTADERIAKTFLPDIKPDMILREWCDPVTGKLALHLQQLIEDARLVESGEYNAATQNKLALAYELRVLDKLLLPENNYSILIEKLEMAIKAQRASKEQELGLLVIKKDFAGFRDLYLDIKDKQVDLVESIEKRFSELLEALVHDSRLLKDEIASLDLNPHSVEVLRNCLDKLGSLNNFGLLAKLSSKKNHTDLIDEIEITLTEIKSQLNDKCKTYIGHISRHINNDEFKMAMSNLHFLESLIGLFATEPEFQDRLKLAVIKLKDQIKSKLTDSNNQFTKLSVTDYIKNPPKIYLSQLDDLKSQHPLFNDYYQQLEKVIAGKISQALTDCKQDPPDFDAQERLNVIKELHKYIPLNIYSQFSEEIDNVEKTIQARSEAERRRLQDLAAFKNMQALVDELYRTRFGTDLKWIVEELMRLINQAKIDYLQQLGKDNIKAVIIPLSKSWIDWQAYIAALKKITEPKTVPVATDGWLYSYTRYIRQNFYLVNPEIPERICHELLIAVSESYKKVFSELIKLRHKDINGKKGFIIIANNFPHLSALFELYVEYLSDRSRHSDSGFYIRLTTLTPQLKDEKMFVVMNYIKEFIINIQQNFEEVLKSADLTGLADIMKDMALHNHSFLMLKEFASQRKPHLPLEFSASFEGSIDYHAMRTQLAHKLIKLQETATQKILEHKRARSANSIDRKEFYHEISTAFLGLKTVKPLIEHVDERLADVNKLELDARARIHLNLCEVKNKILDLITTIPVSDERIYSELNTWYDNLRLAVECFDNTDLAQEAQTMLNEVNRAVNNKLENFKELLCKIDISTLSGDDSTVLIPLIQLKLMSVHASTFKDKTDKIIDAALTHIKKQPNGVQYIARIGIELNKREDEYQGIAQMIISEHAAFKNYAIELRNEKTLRFGINEVLESLGAKKDNTDLNATRLQEYYSEYEKIYWDLVEQGMLQRLETLQNIIKTCKISAQLMDKPYYKKVIDLTAHLFAYWTLLNADAMQDYSAEAATVTDRKYLLQPHAAQVISIFRLLGVDVELTSSAVSPLLNHLVEIGTGEGKSVTIAITALILALQNYEVDCACYSGYLSERDRNDFADIFNDFGLQHYINYGTFNYLCEGIINLQGNVRDTLVELLKKGAKYSLTKGTKTRDKIILIDEVDVFFSKDFYGNFYRPLAELRDDSVSELLLYIWTHRANNDMLRLPKVKASAAFQNCCKLFEGWEALLEEAIKAMIVDVRSFDTPEYIVQNDKIGYREQHGISFDISYRYKTIFAYFCEYEKGELTRDSRDKRAAIIIDCGAFSYAEVPKQYKCVMGVTGTLSTLSAPERKLLTDVYSINKYTYMPSVYGRSKLDFSGDTPQDVKMDKRSAHFMAIINEIKKRRLEKDGLVRPVMVFFESNEVLKKFYHSSELQRSAINPENIKVITEEISDDQKSGLIRQATGSGVVTLLTRGFGRGTDFKCYDDRINKLCGGMHVIQTFISDELSEETQIRGRTARQGDPGSYSMVLVEEDLERYKLGSAAIERMKSTSSLYTTINQFRCNFFLRQYTESLRYADEIKKDHEEALSFVRALLAKNLSTIKDFLLKRNKTILLVNNAKTICLMDATGSMSELLTKAKNTVHTMFERARSILDEKGITATFELQFVVYRNYNCPESSVLQSSGWESDPSTLQQFMRTIEPAGGLGTEAIEVGFWHVNQVSKSMEIKQVILIGDMPPNSRDEVIQKRAGNHGSEYWSRTKFAKVVHANDELKEIIEKQIPVHAFYVHPNAKDSFETIAKSTGGHFGALSIDSPQGAELLTHAVTECILEDLGGKELVDSYREKYAKGYVASSTRAPVLYAAVNEIGSARSGASAAASASSESAAQLKI